LKRHFRVSSFSVTNLLARDTEMERSWKKAFEKAFPCQFFFRDQYLSKGHGNGTVTEKSFRKGISVSVPFP